MRFEQNRLFASFSSLLESRSFIPLITVLGILIRAILLISVRHNSVFFDEIDYETIGVSIWKSGTFAAHGWPTAFRPPAEPLLIATLYGIFGEHAIIVKLFEILLLGLLPVLCATLGRSLGLSRRAANLGALFSAFHPGLAYASTTLYPTAVTAVALTLAVVFSVLADVKGRLSAAVIGGLGYGVAAMSTSTFVPLPVVVSLYFCFKRKYRLALVIGLIGILPTMLWVTRNRMVMGGWLLATNGGVNLYVGANDQATPTTENWVKAPFQMGEHEVAEDRAYTMTAKSWIHEHPARYAIVSVGRAFMVVDSIGHPKTKGVHSGLLSHVIGWCMLPIIVLGIVGLGIYWRHSAGVFTIAALFLVVASSALTLVKPRFRFPCDPLLGTFAAASISSGLNKMKEQDKGQQIRQR